MAAGDRSGIVANGTLYEGFGSDDEIMGIKLEDKYLCVSVDEVFNDECLLPVSINDEFVYVKDAYAKRALIPWIACHVIRSEDKVKSDTYINVDSIK